MTKKRGTTRMDVFYNLTVGAFMSTVSFLFGGWTTLLTMLAVILIFELVTGLAKGAYNKNIDSRIFARGMIKKGAIFIVIILAHFLDLLVAMALGVDIGVSFVVLASIYYIGVETVSILENLGQMGVPIPNFIRERFQQLADTAEEQGEIISKNQNTEEDKEK